MGNKTRRAWQAHRAQQHPKASSVVGRNCGGCTACCETEAVPELTKPFFSRCTHAQPDTGCAIYGRHPASCVAWKCMWLLGADLGERPDRSGIVVNSVPPKISREHPLWGPLAGKMSIVHANCLPDRPNAHRDANFQRWLLTTRQVAEVLRVVGDQTEYLWVIPPEDESGSWLEVSLGWAPLADLQRTGGNGMDYSQQKPRMTMVSLGGNADVDMKGMMEKTAAKREGA